MNVYEIITERITSMLEAGEIPWKKSWNAATQAPRNLITGKEYQGINTFILLSARYQSPYWLTFKQATAKGGTVRKGEKGFPVIFWKIDKQTDEETGKEKTIPLLRYYTVFNVAQIDGLRMYRQRRPTAPPRTEPRPSTPHEQIVNHMPSLSGDPVRLHPRLLQPFGRSG